MADVTEVRRASWQLIRRDGRAMIVVLVVTCLAAVAGLVGPWLLGVLVQGFRDGTGSSTVDVLALLIVGSAVAQLVLTRWARYTAQRMGERALRRLRDEFVDRVLGLPTSVVERAGTGDLMTRSTGDVDAVGSALRDAVPEVFISVVQVVFILGAVFLLHPLLGLCGIVGLPFIWMTARWYLRRARAAYLAEGSANSEVSESLVATAEGARAVEAFGLRLRRVEVGNQVVGRAYDTRVRTLFLRSVLFPGIDFSHALAGMVMLVAGGFLLSARVVDLAAASSASVYMWQLVNPLDRVLQWMEQLQRSGASFARIKGVGSVIADVPSTSVLPADDYIRVAGVHFAYGGGHDVLRGIDLSVRPGERLAIVGPSGAGKSTLGRLLAGVEAPRAGSVTVGQVPIVGLSAEERRRRVVMVTQEHHVFIGTLRDNLTIAAHDADDSALCAALAAVDATWAETLPDGLDTKLGAGDVLLDAAQAQQLALARVVLADPHTVILDEATALLDPTTARHAERSLAAVLNGRTVIAIAHRLHTAHDADRIAMMEDGRITELGHHDELVAADGSYAELWRSWHSSAGSMRLH